MADAKVAATGIVDKPTIIYGLVDPLTNELRYVGKTVKRLGQRLIDHIYAAKRAKRKRHVLAWIAGLLAEGREPEAFVIDIVSAGECWIDAEQFWIAYWRFVGADLCNLTIGGEGAPGHRQSEHQREATRLRMRANPPSAGKPMHPNAADGLKRRRAQLEADPKWKAWASARRNAGFSEQSRAKSTAALKENRHKGDAARKAALQTPEARKRVSDLSRTLWGNGRDKIIAAQNAGKGDEWRRKQSANKRSLWRDPEFRKRTAEAHSYKLTAEDVCKIKSKLQAGGKVSQIAKEFGVLQSHISHIKSGRRWAHL